MFSHRLMHAISVVALLVMTFGVSATLTQEIALSATAYPPPATPVFSMPATGFMGLGWSGDGPGAHRGIDIWSWRSAGCSCKEPTGCGVMPGAEVRAVYDGVVAGIYWGDRSGRWYSAGTFNPGNYPLSVVILEHQGVPGISTNKVYTVYQHMANDDTRESYVAQGLAVGQTVRQNDVIGRQGNWRYYPENAPVTHLHFEVAYKPDTYTLPDRITVDPMPYLIGGGQSACSGAPINSGAPPALKILRPSRANPVDVGTPANPSKFTIEIAYAGSASLQDVTVTVGGKPATIINMTPTRYAMEIQAPPQTGSGRYDLTVSIKGATATEAGAVSYNGASNANVILTLDRSGSMSTDNKMLAAHNAARQFVDLMQVGDGIGVVGFDDRETTAFPLTMITDPPPLSSMIFADTMESGAGKWIPDPPWGLTSVAYRGSAAWTDSPTGNYANNANSILAIADPLAIPASLSAPALSFWHRYDIENYFDYGRVEVSTDNGATWRSLATYTGINTTWSRAVIDLSPYRGQTIRLRFRLTTDASVTRDGWYIDDVTVGPKWVDARADAIAAIGTLTPRGSTSIGGGLQRSQQLLSASAPGRTRAIVLLSDGQENTAPYVSDVLPQIRASQITVHTIGLGTDADQQLMLSIAAQTGGTYNYAPRPDQLASIYNTISGAVSNRQTLITTDGTIAAGATATRDVTVDSSVSEATFWVSWTNAGAGVTFSLQTPGGTTIDAASAAANNDIDYVGGSIYAYYRVRAPTLTPGVWRILLSRTAASSATIIDEPTVATSEPLVERPADGFVEPEHDVTPDLSPDPAERVIEPEPVAQPTPAKHVVEPEPVAQPAATGDEPFVARVLARASLTMGFYLGKMAYLTTEPMICIVTLADNAPITGATVVLTVTLPGQPVALTLPLYDDGRHGDGAAGDGVYATTFIGPFTPGTATFSVIASGRSSASEPFIRQGELSTYIATNPDPYTFVHLPLVVR
jgi:Mg-chelatase subunit ChlD